MPLKQWQEPLQLEMQDKLTRHGTVLNALPTGAGKTYLVAQTIANMPEHQLFVVAPKSVLTSWHNVLKEFGVLDRTVGIINWEKLQTKKTKHFDDKGWHLPKDTLVVIDEAHKGASGPNTKVTKMMAMLKAYKFPVIVQSATLADSPLKLRAAGFLLGLHNFNTSSFYDFCRKNGCFKSPFHNGMDFPKGDRGKKLMSGINTLIRDKMIKCSLDDIPGFPECEIVANLYDLDKTYTKEVNDIYNEMETKLKEKNTNPMVEMLRARQRVELFKVPLLVDLVKEELDENRSVAVFVTFRETMDRLVAALDSRDIKSVTIYGGQKQSERDTNINMFQSNLVHVIIGMSQCAGVGISLHDVHQERPRTALICPDYSATNMKQVLGRIHRVGGTKALNIFVLAAGTIEERIKKAIDRKLNNIDALNGLSDEDLQ